MSTTPRSIQLVLCWILLSLPSSYAQRCDWIGNCNCNNLYKFNGQCYRCTECTAPMKCGAQGGVYWTVPCGYGSTGSQAWCSAGTYAPSNNYWTSCAYCQSGTYQPSDTGGIVCVKLEWFVQEIHAEGTQRVHHSQELETVGRVAAFRDGEFARFRCQAPW